MAYDSLTSPSAQQLLTRSVRKTAPRVTEEQEPGVIRKVSNVALGGLSALGNLLDVPGSMVRDVITANNPLDQLMSPFSPDNRTTGKDILRKAGIIGERDNWTNFLPSMAVEIATDPLTFLAPGSTRFVGKGGEAAHAIKATDDITRVANSKRLYDTLKQRYPQAPTSALQAHVRRMVSAPADMSLAGAERSLDEALASVPSPTPVVATAPPAALPPLQLPRRVGRREARMTTNLKDVVNFTAQDKLPKLMSDLQTYAKANQFASAEDFLAKHGDEPLGAMASVGMPFTRNWKGVGTGPLSQNIAKHLDNVERVATSSAPFRAARMLFDPDVMGTMEKTTQAAATQLSKNIEDYKVRARQIEQDAIFDINKNSKDFAEVFGGEEFQDLNGHTLFKIDSEEKAKEALRSISQLAGEMSQNVDNVKVPQVGKAIDMLMPKHKFKGVTQQVTAKSPEGVAEMTKLLTGQEAQLAGLSKNVIDTVQKMRSATDTLWNDINIRGGNPGLIEGEAYSYMPRLVNRTVWERKADMQRASKMMTMNAPQFSARTPEFAEMPQAAVEGIISNPRFYEGTPEEVAQQLVSNPNYSQFLRQASPEDTVAHATEIAKYLNSRRRELAPYIRTAERPYSRPRYIDPLSAFSSYHRSGQKMRASMDAIFNLYDQGVSLEGSIPLKDAFERAGFKDPMGAVHYYTALKNSSDPQFVEEFVKAANVSEDAANQVLQKHVGLGTIKSQAVPISVTKEFKVPEAYVDAANAAMKPWTAPPEWKQNVLMFYDKARDLLKREFTLPWPAFAVRNLGSGQGANFTANVIQTPSQFAAYWSKFRKSWDMYKNPQKYEDILREIHVMDVPAYGHVRNDVDLIGDMAQPQILPKSPFNLKDVYAASQNRVAQNPLVGYGPATPGYQSAIDMLDKSRLRTPVTKAMEAHGALIEGGGRASALVEWMNRVPLYLYLRETLGFSPEQALAKVHQVHVDYGRLTGMEREWARRLFLFYSFTKRQLGNTFENLWERPGGALATTIKTINRSRNPDELTPDYVAETTSVPLGELPDGSKRYITGFGMPWEDPLSFFGKGVRGAGLEALSRLNPVLKFPLEYSTGQVFFQGGPEGGRPMGDSNPALGQFLANITGAEEPYKLGQLTEAAVSNSPLARYLTTARQLTDVRKNPLAKAANLLTGIQVHDVSPAAIDAILRERTAAALKEAGGKSFIRTYIPEDRLAGMTPQQIADARELQAMLNTLADRAQERKRLSKQLPPATM